MGSRRRTGNQKSVVPRRGQRHDWAVGTEVIQVEADDFDGWMLLLADPLRSKRAYWHLVGSGSPAFPAICAGLRHDNADVRMYCARALDHLVDEEAYPDLVTTLDDDDPRVRCDTHNALACDRCKGNASPPDKVAVLSKAIKLLGSDPSAKVRAIACEVVGRWVHDDARAAAALSRAQQEDQSPAVRTKASWYAPGGTIRKRTARNRG